MVTRAGDPGALGRELAHTADAGLEVEAPTLAALFERAALGMLALSMDPGDRRGRMARLRDQVREYNIYRWGADLISELADIRISEKPKTLA